MRDCVDIESCLNNSSTLECAFEMSNSSVKYQYITAKIGDKIKEEKSISRYRLICMGDQIISSIHE